MIQRIQTLYLVCVILIQVLISQFNFISFSNEGIIYHLNASGIIDQNDNQSLEDSKQIILIVLAILFALISIILFKNRTLQIKFTKFLSFVCFLQLAFVTIGFYHFFENKVEDLQLGLASYLVIVSGILSVLATKAIKKDDNLIKSVDRIR